MLKFVGFLFPKQGFFFSLLKVFLLIFLPNMCDSFWQQIDFTQQFTQNLSRRRNWFFRHLHHQVKVKWFSHVQLFVTSWTIACQAPTFMGFSRQEYWNGLPFPSPGDLPHPGIKPGSPALQADSLSSEPPGNLPICTILVTKFHIETNILVYLKPRAFSNWLLQFPIVSGWMKFCFE